MYDGVDFKYSYVFKYWDMEHRKQKTWDMENKNEQNILTSKDLDIHRSLLVSMFLVRVAFSFWI